LAHIVADQDSISGGHQGLCAVPIASHRHWPAGGGGAIVKAQLTAAETPVTALELHAHSGSLGDDNLPVTGENTTIPLQQMRRMYAARGGAQFAATSGSGLLPAQKESTLLDTVI